MALDPASLVALSELAARPGVPADELGDEPPAPPAPQDDAPARPWSALLAPRLEPLQARVVDLRRLDLTHLDPRQLDLGARVAGLRQLDLAALVSDPVSRRRIATLAGSSVAAGLVAGLLVPTAAEASASGSASTAGASGSAALLSGSASPFPSAPATSPSQAPAPVVSEAPTAADPVPASDPLPVPDPAAAAVLLAAPSSPFAGIGPAPEPAAAPTAAAKPAPAASASPATSASPASTAPRTRTASVVVVADPLPPRPGAPRPAVVAAPVGWKVTRPLPAHSGTGRRIVYAERSAHLWVVGADGTVLRDYKVTGRADRPKPGTYRIFSKSRHTSNPKEKLTFDLMVRFTHGVTGAPIGFHTIPKRYDGTPIQREKDLGKAIGMGGCVRQSKADAEWLYAWSRVGDRVVVLH